MARKWANATRTHTLGILHLPQGVIYWRRYHRAHFHVSMYGLDLARFADSSHRCVNARLELRWRLGNGERMGFER